MVLQEPRAGRAGGCNQGVTRVWGGGDEEGGDLEEQRVRWEIRGDCLGQHLEAALIVGVNGGAGSPGGLQGGGVLWGYPDSEQVGK